MVQDAIKGRCNCAIVQNLGRCGGAPCTEDLCYCPWESSGPTCQQAVHLPSEVTTICHHFIASKMTRVLLDCRQKALRKAQQTPVECFCQRNCPNTTGIIQLSFDQITNSGQTVVKLLPSCQLSPTCNQHCFPQRKHQHQQQY